MCANESSKKIYTGYAAQQAGLPVYCNKMYIENMSLDNPYSPFALRTVVDNEEMKLNKYMCTFSTIIEMLHTLGRRNIR